MRRIRFFDIAKGIAILCVILSHSAIEAQFVVPSHIAKLIVSVCFSFHMPLFFILSGYFMHPERDFRRVKEAKQLLCTYMLTGALVIVGAAGLTFAQHGDLAVVRQWGKAVLYGSGSFSELTLWPVDFRIGAIWFLLALFWAHLLLHVFAKLPYTPIWVVGCFALGYISARYIWLPWSLQSGMCAVAFLYIGYLAKQHDVLDLMQRIRWLWFVAGVAWAVDIAFFGGMSMAMNDYGTRPVLAVVGSLVGTLCIVGISQCVDKVPCLGSALSLAGQSSLAILCAHLIEDDVLPWQMILTSFQGVLPQVPLTFTAFVVRLPLDLLLAVALYHIPVINEWFYPQLAKKQFREKAVVDKA